MVPRAGRIFCSVHASKILASVEIWSMSVMGMFRQPRTVSDHTLCFCMASQCFSQITLGCKP
jgi:hypothetical protein